MRHKSLRLLAALALALATMLLPAQTTTYRNPILGGYHPDPSICRVGDTYYLVNSTFQYFPGVPISTSRDLIHWTQIGNVLTRDAQLPLEDATSWTGIYAPTLRYHDGTYYMITTNVGHGGNFYVTASDPRGPWSDPIWLAQDGIDPSFYFEDGKCYFCSNPGDAIWLCEIDVKTGRQLTESKKLWEGTGGRYPEGPHIYKKDGYYYLLISEGGTELAHGLTIARSKDIYGPYESNPANPILTHCSRKGQYQPIQGTGHGDFVQATDGSWWIVFLAYRQYGGAYHHLGRETFLAPVRWDEGEWPVVNEGMPVDTLMTVALPEAALLESTKTACGTAPGPEWVYLQNPLPANYTFTEDGWTLRPHGTLLENRQPTYIGRRQESPAMTFEATVTPVPAKKSATASGLAVYQIHNGQMQLRLEGETLHVVSILKNLRSVVATAKVKAGKPLTLRITSDGVQYRFQYAEEGKSFADLAELDVTLVSTETTGGFTGVTVGLFTEGESTDPPAVFRTVQYTEEK